MLFPLLETILLQQPRGHRPSMGINPLSWGLQPSKPSRQGDVPRYVLGTVKVMSSH